jgi:osmotically-inducible protein OsmY
MKQDILLLTAMFALSFGAPAADKRKKDGDSTGKNPPARDSKPPKSTDQSERPEERRNTEAIRVAVMKDHSLSVMAKGITIVTANNRVTLSGSVKSMREKIVISSLARAAAGEIPVDDQLEVKTAKETVQQ